MKNKVLVRKATPADIPAIYLLVKELAVYENAAEAVTASIEDYSQAFNNNIFDCLVAEYEGEVAGVAIYYQAFSTWKGKMFFLEDFVVAEAYRRYGIGQVLFDAFIADARARDAVMVKWQVLDWNEPAIRFYEKNKAIIEKEWWNGKIWF